MIVMIPLYEEIKERVIAIYEHLHLNKYANKLGRKLAIPVENIISMGIFKQKLHIKTKRSIYDIFKPKCSYKTLVVNLNRFVWHVLFFIKKILDENKKDSHWIKHTDSTDIPVCSNRKAKDHKTMKDLAQWGKTGKGWFYGLKLHLTSDLFRKFLSLRLSSGNANDRDEFMKLNKDLDGLFLADSGYVSKKLRKEFNIPGIRKILAKPRKNMKDHFSLIEQILYSTRKLIELNFRSLKEFYGLVTSLPRSVKGYLAHYLYSLTAYLLI